LAPFLFAIIVILQEIIFMKNVLFVLLILFISQSCKMKRLDTTQMAEQMKNAEIKRITPAQISSFANEWGTEIAAYLNKNKANISNIDSLSGLFKASISKVDLTNTYIKNIDEKERQILDAYKYSLKNNQPIVANLQQLKGGEIQLFTAPVKGQNNQIWRIEFTKKEIIRKASVKDIKKMATEK
jgi:hypothetical protein